MSEYLPPELLIEILTKLPVKTLLRCTSVCKSWYSLITSPDFITTHLNRTNANNNNGNQIFVRHFIRENNSSGTDHYSVHIDNETFDNLATLDLPLDTCFRIIGSSNGLICLSDDVWDYVETVILWNPSIRKYVTLPPPNVTFESHGPIQHTIGFGFHPATNDFKVVRVVYLIPDIEPKVPPEVELYELSTGCWRSISAGEFKYVVNFRDSQAFLNGVVHWTGYEGEDGLPSWIVSFDLENEALGTMMVPPSLQQEYGLGVAVFGDSLSLMHHKVSGNDRHCFIWVMKEYGIAKSWRKQFTIDLNNGFLTRPFGIRENGEFLLTTLYGYDSYENQDGLVNLVSYDPKSEQIKHLGIRGLRHAFYKDAYVESLVLVKGLSEFSGRRESSCDAVALEGASCLPKEDDEGQGNKRSEKIMKE